MSRINSIKSVLHFLTETGTAMEKYKNIIHGPQHNQKWLWPLCLVGFIWADSPHLHQSRQDNQCCQWQSEHYTQNSAAHQQFSLMKPSLVNRKGANLFCDHPLPRFPRYSKTIHVTWLRVTASPTILSRPMPPTDYHILNTWTIF